MTEFLFASIPSPRSWKTEFLAIVGSGIFVSLFLLVFQPYGTADFVSEDKTLFLMGYGGIIVIIFYSIKILAMPLIRFIPSCQNWTIAKQISALVSLIVLTSLAWYAYWGWYFNAPLTLPGWGRFFLLSFSVTVFPFLAVLAALYIAWLQWQHGTEGGQENSESQQAIPATLRLQGLGEGEVVHLKANQLLFVRAARNYVEVWYHNAGSVNQVLLRSSLQEIANQLPGNLAQRCHRSYLVNPQRIAAILSRGRTVFARLDVNSPLIPISRKNHAHFRQLKPTAH
ncbi:MAG: LytTR family DNA-binding domain-containing protein [Gammaproteobacteria bacterium]